MKLRSGDVIAEGCEHCEPRVDPGGERENDRHVSVRFDRDYRHLVLVNGEEGHKIHEAWCGSPGRVIEYTDPIRVCCCRSKYSERDSVTGEVVEPNPGMFRQLVEYDCVEVVKGPDS